MAITQAHLDRLQEMLAEGVTEARLPDGSSVRFDSLNELKERIRWVEDKLGANPTYTNFAYPSHKRGF